MEEKRIRIEREEEESLEAEREGREGGGRDRGRKGGGSVHDEEGGGGRAEYGLGGEILKTLLLYLFIARPL